MKKGQKLYSILNMRCPRCHEDHLFVHRLSELKDPLAMKEQCGTCSQKFEIEPGFYWGAMYIAYGISSFLLLGSFAILKFLIGLSMTQSYIIVVLFTILMIPVVFRLSRSLWINLYVKYNPLKE